MINYFYNNKYPLIDEIVLVKVVNSNLNLGYYVELLEYNNIPAFINISEVSKRKVKSLRKLICNDKILPLLVLNVDKEKGFIDLSKKSLYDGDLDKFYEGYEYAKKIKYIGDIICKIYLKYNKIINDTDNMCNLVLINSIWKLYKNKKKNNINFKKIYLECLNNIKSIMNKDFFYEEFINIVEKIFKKLIIKNEAIIIKQIQIKTYEIDGVNLIKKILTLPKEYNNFKIIIESPPIYNIEVKTVNIDDSKIKINNLINNIIALSKNNSLFLKYNNDIIVKKPLNISLKKLNDNLLNKLLK